MAKEELDLGTPSCLHLTSAFLAMESPGVLISLARDCGGGSVTERVQKFVWDHCVNKADVKTHIPYLKSFVKKLIVEVESEGHEVLDLLYERVAFYMTSLKDDEYAKESSRVLKCISFLFPDDCFKLPSCSKSRKLVVQLQCSLNMLEGDTGCSIWPSSLFLSELILSFPEIFSNRSCFEVGSGVGLVGICLAHVKASKVVLTDGDLSSLANLKLNLEINHLSTGADLSERTVDNPYLVKCIHLPWESVESELQDFMPDIILGADVIYDPLCLPHLVQVLVRLLKGEKSYSEDEESYSKDESESCNGIEPSCININGIHNNGEVHNPINHHGSITCQDKLLPHGRNVESAFYTSKGPVAFIASVIRNMDTFYHFHRLSDQANLNVEDVTVKFTPLNLLPYMRSYDRSSVRLFTVTRA